MPSSERPRITDAPSDYPQVRPRRNAATFWYNVRANGREDPRVLHAGLAMAPQAEHLEKWGLNIWVRDPRLVGQIIACPAWHVAHGDETW
jgi:hypothetical protein